MLSNVISESRCTDWKIVLEVGLNRSCLFLEMHSPWSWSWTFLFMFRDAHFAQSIILVLTSFVYFFAGMHVIPAGIRSSAMTTFRPRSSCSTIIDGDSVCPICQMCYDASARRKLVDSNCGHSRCYKCMFQTNTCPLCCGADLSSSPRRKFTLPGNFL